MLTSLLMLSNHVARKSSFSMTKRLDWLDFAKGIAIVLVVVGHAGRGISSAGISDTNNVLSLIDAIIYAFHMPFFFILSGVTFGIRPPENVKPDLLKRVWRIFYVMTIWTYAFLFLRALSGDHPNTRGAWTDILVFPVPPFAHFWFLWALLLNILVFTLLRLFFQKFFSEKVFWAGAFLLVLFVNLAVTIPPSFSQYFSAALSYSAAFVVGANLGIHTVHTNISESPRYLMSSVLFLILLLASVSIETPFSRVASGTILSLILLPTLIFLAEKFYTSGWVQAIIYLGALSLPIYVMHTIFSAFFRIVFFQIGINNLWVHLVLGTAIGVLGPLAGYLIAKRFGFLRLVGLA